MSEVGNKHLAEHDTTFNYLNYVYKDTDSPNAHLYPERNGCGTVIKISKITPKQVIAKFFRYENNDLVNIVEETSQPSCRYKVWCDGVNNEPYIQLKKSKSNLWEHDILRELAYGESPGLRGRFYFNDKYLNINMVAQTDEEIYYEASYERIKGIYIAVLSQMENYPDDHYTEQEITIIGKIYDQIKNLQP